MWAGLLTLKVRELLSITTMVRSATAPSQLQDHQSKQTRSTNTACKVLALKVREWLSLSATLHCFFPPSSFLFLDLSPGRRTNTATPSSFSRVGPPDVSDWASTVCLMKLMFALN